MSMWVDPDEAPAPEPAADPEPGSRPDDLDVDAADLGDADENESGIADARRAVRVWVDDDRRLTAVLISNRWRERLRRSTLEAAFADALSLAQGRVAEPVSVDLPTAADPDARGPGLTWTVLDAHRTRLESVRAEAAAMESDPGDIVPATLVGVEVEATSDNALVTVRLAVDASTRSVHFDEGWLAQARVGDICDAVLQAHRQAYARWQPPRTDPGSYGRIARETAALSRDLATAIAKGVWV